MVQTKTVPSHRCGSVSESGDRLQVRLRDSVRAAICIESLCKSNLWVLPPSGSHSAQLHNETHTETHMCASQLCRVSNGCRCCWRNIQRLTDRNPLPAGKLLTCMTSHGNRQNGDMLCCCLQAGEYVSVFVDNGTGSAINVLQDSLFSGILLGVWSKDSDPTAGSGPTVWIAETEELKKTESDQNSWIHKENF